MVSVKAKSDFRQSEISVGPLRTLGDNDSLNSTVIKMKLYRVIFSPIFLFVDFSTHVVDASEL